MICSQRARGYIANDVTVANCSRATPFWAWSRRKHHCLRLCGRICVICHCSFAIGLRRHPPWTEVSLAGVQRPCFTIFGVFQSSRWHNLWMEKMTCDCGTPWLAKVGNDWVRELEFYKSTCICRHLRMYHVRLWFPPASGPIWFQNAYL